MSASGVHPLAEVARLLRAHRLAVAWTTFVGLLAALTSLSLARAAAGLLEQALQGAFMMPLALVLWMLARVALGIVQQHLSTQLGHRVATELRESLVHQVLRADVRSIPSHSELLTGIAHDVTQVQTLVAFRAPTLLSDAATSSALIAYALVLAPTTCLLAALPAVVALPLLLQHGRRQARTEDEARAAYTRVYEHVADTLEAALVVRHHQAEEYAEAALRKTLDAFEAAALRARRRAAWIAPLPQLAAFGSFVIVAARIAEALSEESLTRADALALVVVLSLAARPLLRLASLANELGSSMASVRRIASLLRMPQAERAASSTAPESRRHRVERIHVSRVAHTLLEDASLELRRGELVALVAENGAGKSSLLLALAELLPHRKEVFGDGDDEASLEAAWVPQSPALILGTVRSNIALRAEADDARCREALNRVGMTEVDLDRAVEPGGRNFSMGERHKIALARALYLGRRILLLDEPTASLDAQSLKTFLDTLRTLREDHAILLVSHDERVIEKCDRVIRIEGKKLVDG